jgi:hypothetical protein
MLRVSGGIVTKEGPTAEQLDRELQLPPGTITLERLTAEPTIDDRYRIWAVVEPGGRGSWRVTLRDAWP